MKIAGQGVEVLNVDSIRSGQDLKVLGPVRCNERGLI